MKIILTRLGLIFFFLVSAFFIVPASAKTLAIVNNKKITDYEVDQKIRLSKFFGEPSPSRTQALEELINNTVKIIEANRLGYRIDDKRLDLQISGLARTNGLSLIEFHQKLQKAGVDYNAYRRTLAATLLWRLVRENKISKQTQNLRTNSIARKKDVNYTFIPIIFVVPRGANLQERHAAAKKFSEKNPSCDALAEADSLRDMVIEPTRRKISSELNPQFLKILEATPIGKASPPIASGRGFEVFVVCNKNTDQDGFVALRKSNSNLRSVIDPAAEKAYLEQARARTLIRYL